jgi:transcriptional regulator NrdR family protein
MYDRQKLKKALLLSFAKRDINKDDLESLLNSLETQRSGE